MYFKEKELFHVYNQGNNRQKIFFTEENYDYFLHKIRQYILPYADILAWCLMPNHFHLMLYVRNKEAVLRNSDKAKADPVEFSRTMSLNDSIGIALRSYTRGVNHVRKRSGSLFRNNTKAVEVSSLKGVMPTMFRTKNVELLRSVLEEKQYPQICFNYIHMNPVRAKLVKNAIDYKYSSAQDFIKQRKSSITNVELAKEIVGLSSGAHLSEPLTL